MKKNLFKFKAVIFDLDGTLVDSIADLADAMNFVLQQNGFPVHPQIAYRYFVGNGIRKLVERALPENERTEEKTTSCHRQMLDYYKEHCIDYTKPYDGIQNLLDFLTIEGLQLAVLSNKADFLVKKIVAKLFPDTVFCHIRGALPNIPIKPNPAGALQIAEQIGINPKEFLYLGDTDIDIQTAISAGMFSVGCTWGFRQENELRQANAQMIIHHPDDLIDFIKIQK